MPVSFSPRTLGEGRMEHMETQGRVGVYTLMCASVFWHPKLLVPPQFLFAFSQVVECLNFSCGQETVSVGL